MDNLEKTNQEIFDKIKVLINKYRDNLEFHNGTKQFSLRIKEGQIDFWVYDLNQVEVNIMFSIKEPAFKITYWGCEANELFDFLEKQKRILKEERQMKQKAKAMEFLFNN